MTKVDWYSFRKHKIWYFWEFLIVEQLAKRLYFSKWLNFYSRDAATGGEWPRGQDGCISELISCFMRAWSNHACSMSADFSIYWFMSKFWEGILHSVSYWVPLIQWAQSILGFRIFFSMKDMPVVWAVLFPQPIYRSLPWVHCSPSRSRACLLLHLWIWLPQISYFHFISPHILLVPLELPESIRSPQAPQIRGTSPRPTYGSAPRALRRFG